MRNDRSEKISPDYSLERDGVPLAEWLWRLVGDDKTARLAAGDALQAMWCGIPSVHTDLLAIDGSIDVASQQKRFETGVRTTVSAPNLDGAEFVRRLGAYLIALKNDWLRRCDAQLRKQDKRDNKFERIAKRIKESLDGTTNAEGKQRLQDRLTRLAAIYVGGAVDCNNDPNADAEPLSSAFTSASIIFESLREQLLLAPDAIVAMLGMQELRFRAHHALESIGPVAASFGPILLEQMIRDVNADCEFPRFEGARALGSISRGQPELVAELIQKLKSDNKWMRIAAASALEYVGVEVCGREHEVVTLLLPMTERQYEDWSAINALASVGRHLPQARDRIIQLASPRIPQFVEDEFIGFRSSHDATMGERGIALSAMRYLIDYAEECVPVLTEAIDSFEEFDPDESYGGPIGRVSWTLAAFGPQAASAAPLLAAHLNDPEEDFPKVILDALAAMGPSARSILPQLYAFRDQVEEGAKLEEGPVDRHVDPVGWTIQQIERVAPESASRPTE